jgi:hypothetical protein
VGVTWRGAPGVRGEVWTRRVVSVADKDETDRIDVACVEEMEVPGLRGPEREAASLPLFPGGSVVEADVALTGLDTATLFSLWERGPRDAQSVALVARCLPGEARSDVDFQFLWAGGRRTPLQTEILLALGRPFVATATLAFSSEEDLREAAAAPQATPLDEPEMAAIQSLWSDRRRTAARRVPVDGRDEPAAAGF